jgi:flavin-dependent dehydrogenase
MKPTRPIEIIGGGLAGLSLGLALRRAGMPVTLFEAGGYPRHRVCGEFITGLADATVERLGLGPILGDALLHHEVAWFFDGRLARRQRLPSPARALSRHQLDARLARALVESGGTLHAHSRTIRDPASAGCVFATGRRRGSARWLGLKIHAHRLPLHCDLELHLGTESYIGLTQVEDGRVNVCGLFRRRELSAKGPALLLAYLRAANMSALADRLTGANFDETSLSAVAAVDFDQHVPDAGRLALGDACAMIPPFTGNGMAMAFQSAEIALEPLVAYANHAASWPETTGSIQAALQQRFRTRLAAADWVHPFLLQPQRQRWLTRLSRAHLLPLRPLYSVLH